MLDKEICMRKDKIVQGTLVSAVITLFFIVGITIAGELYKVADASGKMVNPIKDYLKALHGHHWVGKGIWAVVLFIVLSVLFSLVLRPSTDGKRIGSMISALTVSLIVCTLAIYGFFTYEFFIAH